MSERITHELRLFLADPYREWAPKEKKDQELKDALDNIDAINANLERENESLRRELDRVLGEEHDFAPESHYMMLPKDSDGTPVHVGDVVEWCDSWEAIDVIGIGANDTLFYVDPDGDGEQAEWTTARNKRVRHKPTVEDVLGEFFEEVGDGLHTLKAVDTQVIIAKYAAKLQLRGDAE